MTSEIKKFFKKSAEKVDHRLTMEGLLKQARISFEKYLNPKIFEPEQRFSRQILRDAHGIVFITEVKAGFLFGVKGGSGVIICRTENDSWSAPIAIGTCGASFGFQAGASKVDHIIILPSPNHVKCFLGKGQLQIKGNAEAVLAKYGRDANVGVGVNNKGVAPVLSYSFGVKGLYGGISLDGTILLARKECNRHFYGRPVKPKQIGSGEIDVPSANADYCIIVQLLNDYTTADDNHVMHHDHDIMHSEIDDKTTPTSVAIRNYETEKNIDKFALMHHTFAPPPPPPHPMNDSWNNRSRSQSGDVNGVVVVEGDDSVSEHNLIL